MKDGDEIVEIALEAPANAVQPNQSDDVPKHRVHVNQLAGAAFEAIRIFA